MLNKIVEISKNHPFIVIPLLILTVIASVITIITASKQNLLDNWAWIQGLLSSVPSVVWYCLVSGLGGALIGYWLGRRSETTHLGALQNNKESQLSHRSLSTIRESLMSKYGLDIVSAKYGLKIKATEDVTEKVISGLVENGEIFVDNDLVGGDDNDPVKNVNKELYVDYIQGKPFSKTVPERSILSITDLIPDSKDNVSESPPDFGPTQNSRWRIE